MKNKRDKVLHMLALQSDAARYRKAAYMAYRNEKFKEGMAFQLTALADEDEYTQLFSSVTQATRKRFMDAYIAWKRWYH